MEAAGRHADSRHATVYPQSRRRRYIRIGSDRPCGLLRYPWIQSKDWASHPPRSQRTNNKMGVVAVGDVGGALPDKHQAGDSHHADIDESTVGRRTTPLALIIVRAVTVASPMLV